MSRYGAANLQATISDDEIEFAKAEPSLSDLYTVAALNDVSISYAQEESAFIAPAMFPVIMSDKPEGKYYLFDEGDFHRDEARERAPGTESEGSGYAQTSASFACTRYSFHKDIPSEHYNSEDDASEVDINSTEFVTQKMLICRERKAATTFFTTGVWGTDVTGVAANPAAGQFLRWDKAGSTPLADLETGLETVQLATGRRPNAAIVGKTAWKIVKNHPDFVDRIKYVQGGQVTEGLVATLLSEDGSEMKIYVGKAVYNTKAKGVAAVNDWIWNPKRVLLVYANPKPSRRRLTAGAMYTWNGYYGAGSGSRMKRMEMPLRDSVRIEGDTAFVCKVMASKAGYLLDAVVT